MPKHDDSSIRSWDAVADDWVSHADENDYRNCFLLPLTLELLGDVRGVRILDLGCGEGGYSRELAARGARVVGVDGSAQLVAVAQRRATKAGQQIEFLCANASSLEQITTGTFDVVLASMVLMDVEDYEGAVHQAWRVLAPGGVLLMSITHPCFSAPVSEWVRTDSDEPSHFAVDRYFERLAWDDFITPRFRRQPYGGWEDIAPSSRSRRRRWSLCCRIRASWCVRPPRKRLRGSRRRSMSRRRHRTSS